MSATRPVVRLASIDCLRGAASLAVVLFHNADWGQRAAQAPAVLRAIYGALSFGDLGVPLFFVISGFCIHLRTAVDAPGGALSFGQFWRRRLQRLYPPYFVALCGSMLLVLAAYLIGSDAAILTLYADPKPRAMAVDFVVHATMLHGLIPGYDALGGNPAYWTLAREEYFYLLYAPLLFVRRKVGMLVALAGVLALGLATHFVALGVNDRPLQILLVGSAFVLWIQWTLGMAAAEAHARGLRLPAPVQHPAFVLLWAALAVAAHDRVPVATPVLWGLAFFTMLNAAVARERAGAWPATRLTRWLAYVGIFSYSLYLVHIPVRVVMRQVLARVPLIGDPWVYALSGALVVAVSYQVGKLFFLLVERRFLAGRHGFVWRPRWTPERDLPATHPTH